MMAVAGYSSYIANIVFSAILGYTAIMLNSITIHAIRKASSLPKPLKTLLLSLAVSDVCVGLVQPFHIAVHVMKLEPGAENNPTFKKAFLAYLSLGNLLYYTTFFGVVALTVDRFLAIHLHLRYQELVTHKRVVVAVISMWVFGAIISSLTALLDTTQTDRYAVFASLELFCLTISAVLYFKIYLAVRHHANQMHALHVQQEAQNVEITEMANAARLRKLAVGTFFVYLVFLICYLPMNCIYFATFFAGWSSTVDGLVHYALSLVFLNSSLNSLIYCWKMRHIRHAILDILRKIWPSRN